MHRRCQQEHNIHWIGESLLIDDFKLRLVVTLLDDLPIERDLNLVTHFGALRIRSMEQQFLCAPPPWIDIAHRGLDPSMLNVDVVLPWQQDAMHVRPTHRTRQYPEQKPCPSFHRSIPQNPTQTKMGLRPHQAVEAHSQYYFPAALAPTSSNRPSVIWIISSSTTRFFEIASFRVIETILFARNAAMQPNSPRCTISIAPRP